MLSNFPVWLFDSGDEEKPTGRPSACFSSSLTQRRRSPSGFPNPRRRHRVRGSCPRASLKHGAHDDGGPRPPLPREGAVRPHDLDPDTRRRNDGVRSHPGARRRCTSPAGGRREVPRDLGLRGLHRGAFREGKTHHRARISCTSSRRRFRRQGCASTETSSGRRCRRRSAPTSSPSRSTSHEGDVDVPLQDFDTPTFAGLASAR